MHLRMRHLATAAVAIGMMSMAGVAQATTLDAVQGNVFVNQGAGFKPAQGGATLEIGDAVMVKAGGTASLIYADGCSTAVAVGAVVSVGAQSPCATRASYPKPYHSGVYDPRDSREAPPSSQTSYAPGGIDPGLLIAGGIAIGVGIYAVNRSGRNNDAGRSP